MRWMRRSGTGRDRWPFLARRTAIPDPAASNNCSMHTTTAPPDVPAGCDDLVDALLSASRAMVGLAARSPQPMADISAELGVNPSTGTRMCDRLVRKGLARRYRTAGDRRAVRSEEHTSELQSR